MMKIKIWHIVVVIAILIGIIAIATILTIKHNNEVERLEAEIKAQQARLDSITAAEQARVAEKNRQDSLYANFTTPDLNTFQVKGFVKKIEMYLGDRNPDFKQYLYISFDTLGNLVSGSTKVIYSCGSLNDLLSLHIKRDAYRIKTMSFKKNYPKEGYDGIETKGYFSFTYKNDSIEKITVDFGNIAGADADMFTDIINVTEYGNNLPKKINFSSTSFWGGPNGLKNIDSYVSDLKYTKFDQVGNWTEMVISCYMTTKIENLFEKRIESKETEKYTKTLSRNITYFTPEEIFKK